jgi:hypothetical protein
MTDNWLSGIERRLASNFPPKPQVSSRGAAQVELPPIVAAELARDQRMGLVGPVDRLAVDELAAPVPVLLPLSVSENGQGRSASTVGPRGRSVAAPAVAHLPQFLRRQRPIALAARHSFEAAVRHDPAADVRRISVDHPFRACTH